MVKYDYDSMEEQILNEVPYNATKHFLFQLPEMFSWLMRIAFFFVLTYIFIVSIITASVMTMTTYMSQNTDWKPTEVNGQQLREGVKTLMGI